MKREKNCLQSLNEFARKMIHVKLIKQNVTERFVNNGVGYDQISEVLNSYPEELRALQKKIDLD